MTVDSSSAGAYGTSFQGTVALVSGAAQGIGAAVVATLASIGARVVALDQNGKGLHDSVAGLAEAGSAVVVETVDVRDSTAVDRCVDRVERDVGPIEVLVNIAGVMRTGRVTELTDADWGAVLDVNAGGVFHLSRAVARAMLPRRSGSIITVASNAGQVPRQTMAAYSASKAAAAAFTRCLGLEVAPYGIRCNVVSPGSTDTAMLRAMWPNEQSARSTIEGSPEAFRVGIPLGKLATPQDVANAVVFLASPLAGHITLQDLTVDGGASLGA